MSQWIDGVHHIALKPTAEQYEKTVEFYTQLLGFEVKKSWGDPQRPCLMVSCGDNSCMEILNGEEPGAQGGGLGHNPFSTSPGDELVERVRQAGYEIAVEPKDVELAGSPIRIAFCWGPMGEYIEFFWEK